METSTQETRAATSLPESTPREVFDFSRQSQAPQDQDTTDWKKRYSDSTRELNDNILPKLKSISSENEQLKQRLSELESGPKQPPQEIPKEAAQEGLTREDVVKMLQEQSFEILHKEKIELAGEQYAQLVKEGLSKEKALEIGLKLSGIKIDPSFTRQDAALPIASVTRSTEPSYLDIPGMTPEFYEQQKAKGYSHETISKTFAKMRG